MSSALFLFVHKKVNVITINLQMNLQNANCAISIGILLYSINAFALGSYKFTQSSTLGFFLTSQPG